ncbi:MAG TPA: alpha/beta hydrolase [Solirubrobacterales bacterium]|nr:alpha/beta hydrolase [Solirubrobacterales bacterium]
MAIDNAYWRDPALGEPRTLELPGGPVRAFDTGSGAPIVFVHGLLVNANLWRKVVSRLVPDFRCIALDMPLGSHQVPLPAAAPRGAPAAAAMVADALDALDLDGATLVGNDTGGAISQIAVTTRPERVGRLVLTSCDYRDNFPPKMFSYLKLAAAVPGLLWAMLQPMRMASQRHTPIAYGWLVKRPIDRAAEDSYVGPAIADADIRRDVRGFMRGSDTSHTNAAADRLGEFDRPALIAWSQDDRFFPVEHGRRLAADLPDARFELVPDARTFSMEDNPGRLSELIAEFVRRS